MADYLERYYPEEKNEIDAISSGEEREDLIKQLRHPELEYIEEIDLYLFLLKIGRRVIRKTIYPDIIVHRRGTTQNHMATEAKKTKNKNREARFYDLLKLATLTATQGNFQYHKGIFIDLPVAGDLLTFHHWETKPTAFKNVFEYLPK